jgi:putative sterol carrier protein
MTKEILLESISQQAKNVAPLGAKLKFKLGDDFVIHIDGSGDTNVVTDCDDEAECTISTDIDTLLKLRSGELNPMMAVMGGKVKISGNMGLAMKLQSLLN